MDYIVIYNTNKYRYLQLLGTADQTGGGAWSNGSDGNDSTYHMLSEFGFMKFIPGSDVNTINDTIMDAAVKKLIKEKEDDRFEYYKDVKSTNKAFAKLFANYERSIKKHYAKNSGKNKSIVITPKNADYYYTSQYAYIGVIIYCLKHSYECHTKYLKRALVWAYRDYIKTIQTQEATGWRDWKSRVKSLISEIKLINYALNTAKKNVGIIRIKSNASKDDNNRITDNQIDRLLKKAGPLKTVDKIYLKYRKTKSRYSFQKYFVQPAIDPRILDEGTIMLGHEGRKATSGKKIRHSFIVVKGNNNSHRWKVYDPFDDISLPLLDEKAFIDIYGKHYHQVMKY
jgi:hypothetical protein